MKQKPSKYSSETKGRVLEAIAFGLTHRTIKEGTGVPLATISKWRNEPGAKEFIAARKKEEIEPVREKIVSSVPPPPIISQPVPLEDYQAISFILGKLCKVFKHITCIYKELEKDDRHLIFTYKELEKHERRLSELEWKARS